MGDDTVRVTVPEYPFCADRIIVSNGVPVTYVHQAEMVKSGVAPATLGT